MKRSEGACEVPFAPAHGRRPVVARFDGRRFRWDGVPAVPYKLREDGPLAWRGIQRFVLLGGVDDAAAFHVRYFEIAPGGYSSLERHRHAHAVVVVRGRGQVRIGQSTYRVKPMDFVYIPPNAPHQFRAGRQAFGFLCPVDAVRDRPRPVREGLRAPRKPPGSSRRRPRGMR